MTNRGRLSWDIAGYRAKCLDAAIRRYIKRPEGSL